MSAVAAHHLLGGLDEGKLTLLAGPDYARILRLGEASGIPFVQAHETSGTDSLKGKIARSGKSLLVIAAMHEVEGTLDRSAFDGHLAAFAYEADRVVYAGTNGAAVVWPVAPGTTMRVTSGHLSVSQKIDVIAAGEKVVGLTVDRL